jgi:hypothetical protein
MARSLTGQFGSYRIISNHIHSHILCAAFSNATNRVPFTALMGSFVTVKKKRRHDQYASTGGRYGPVSRIGMGQTDAHDCLSPIDELPSSGKGTGRGSFDPYKDLKSRQGIWEDGVPVACPPAEALRSQREELVKMKAALPAWCIVTHAGLFCSTCMGVASKVASGAHVTGPSAAWINGPCTSTRVSIAIRYHTGGRPPTKPKKAAGAVASVAPHKQAKPPLSTHQKAAALLLENKTMWGGRIIASQTPSSRGRAAKGADAHCRDLSRSRLQQVRVQAVFEDVRPGAVQGRRCQGWVSDCAEQLHCRVGVLSAGC